MLFLLVGFGAVQAAILMRRSRAGEWGFVSVMAVWLLLSAFLPDNQDPIGRELCFGFIVALWMGFHPYCFWRAGRTLADRSAALLGIAWIALIALACAGVSLAFGAVFVAFPSALQDPRTCLTPSPLDEGAFYAAIVILTSVLPSMVAFGQGVKERPAEQVASSGEAEMLG